MVRQDRLGQLQRFVVTADQMQAIESRVFAAGLPIAALMEKVGYRLASRIQALYPPPAKIGILVGPGHNGGDALVVARELHIKGYEVGIYCPIHQFKSLTGQHLQYVTSLNIPPIEHPEGLRAYDVVVDGLFGMGLQHPVEGDAAQAIDFLNAGSQPVLSIDLPSGLHTDTGGVLGTAVRATHTFCLGLWKLGLLQDQALEYAGNTELIDIDLPLADIVAVLGEPRVQQITPEMALAHLPLHRSPATHKYKMGHLLLICGSRRYAGGAILTGLGARASGVGMLSIAAPESLKSVLTAQLPEALIIDCPETKEGTIAKFPAPTFFVPYPPSFDAIACGPGLTPDAAPVIQAVLGTDCPLVLDADGLNVLASLGTIPTLSKRKALTVLTPHGGEFKRLFPDLAESLNCRVTAVRTAAERTGAIVLLKGARVAIANSQGSVWINPQSTPALARGGSGDVLTGLMGGLLAQGVLQHVSVEAIVQSAVWWHAQAGILAAQERTELGVDAFTLTQYLIPALRSVISDRTR